MFKYVTNANVFYVKACMSGTVTVITPDTLEALEAITAEFDNYVCTENLEVFTYETIAYSERVEFDETAKGADTLVDILNALRKDIMSALGNNDNVVAFKFPAINIIIPHTYYYSYGYGGSLIGQANRNYIDNVYLDLEIIDSYGAYQTSLLSLVEYVEKNANCVMPAGVISELFANDDMILDYMFYHEVEYKSLRDNPN